MIRSIFAFLLVFMTWTGNTAMASSHSVHSVTVNPTNACPGDEIEVSVEVRLNGSRFNPKLWGSTSINGECFDNENYFSNNGTNFYSETFVIVAPEDVGDFNIEVETFALDGCLFEQDEDSVSVEVDTCGDELDPACTIEQRDGFVAITCGDTVAYVFDGADGEDGEDGQDGEDGEDGDRGPRGWRGPRGVPGLSCTVEDRGDCADIICEDGTNATICDGTSCTVVEEEGCAIIVCEDESSAEICDGEDGEDGEDGTSCTVVRRFGRAVIRCGWARTVVWDGLSCWDLNFNRLKDACHPTIRHLFEGECPETFDITYECENVDSLSNKAQVAASVYENSTCTIERTCVEYLLGLEYSLEDAQTICNYTEDVNSDGTIDALDCQGPVGPSGPQGAQGPVGPTGSIGAQGPQGEPGEDGRDGADGVDGQDGLDGADGTDGLDGKDGRDGENCSVVDNGDGTCTISCPDSEVLVNSCGDGGESFITNLLLDTMDDETEVLEDPGPNPCGAFGNGGLFLLGAAAAAAAGANLLPHRRRKRRIS